LGITPKAGEYGEGRAQSERKSLTDRYFMSAELIPALCGGPELQHQIRKAKANSSKDYFDVWWLGQSGFLIQWDGKCLLFDPYLSDSLTKKYAATAKPHVRLSELVIDPLLLDCVDLVTSSHNHTDHLDGETLIPLLKANKAVSFVIPEANRDFVTGRLHCDRNFPLGLSDGEHVEVKGFTFHGIPSAHNTVERDEKARPKFMGYVVQFGKFAVYHSGDTLWFDGLEKILKPFNVDVAFLPINGNDPARGVAGNLNASEAVLLGKAIDAGVVIPHHYNMFAFNTADPNDFVREAKTLQQAYAVLRHGERWTGRK
jgi:L-ascorbate metabolism protein UlaG (beta-lactamase superfamily)